MEKFSPSACERLKYYVYKLIDPTDGRAFYIGAGKENDVFLHADGVPPAQNKGDSFDKHKLKTVALIKANGLRVEHIILRWGMTKNEAFEVAEALNGSMASDGDSVDEEFGPTSAALLQKRFDTPVYDEPEELKYIIVKVPNRQIAGQAAFPELPRLARYEATRECAELLSAPEEEYKYLFSVTQGIVKEVYFIRGWFKKDGERVFTFIATAANEDIRSRFIEKRIPDVYCKRGLGKVVFSINK